jgi:hypothetical protein
LTFGTLRLLVDPGMDQIKYLGSDESVISIESIDHHAATFIFAELLHEL